MPTRKPARMKPWTGYQVVNARGVICGHLWWGRSSAVELKRELEAGSGSKFRIAKVRITELTRKRTR